MNPMPVGALEQIHRYLVSLRLPRALEVLDATLQRFEQGDSTLLEVLETLLGEACTTRETRRIKMALQSARRGTLKTLAGYDFSFQPSLDRDRIMTLAQWALIERRQTVHFIGPPGTGKSHLAIALGVEAARTGKSVYFGSLAELIASMTQAEHEGRLPQRVRFLARHRLLIVDEMGDLPIGSNGGNLFFQLVNACYERGALSLTSNRHFDEGGGEVFGDSVVAAALLERLLHHARVVHIEGASYRLREHVDLLPDPLRNRPLLNPPPAKNARPRAGRSHQEAA